MAPSFDCAMSSLLCAEDNSSVFGDDGDEVFEYGVVMEDFDDRWHQGKYQMDNQNMGFYGREEILIGLPLPSEEVLALMIKKECEHLPASDYLKRLKNGDLDLAARQGAIDWIKKVHAHFNFGPLCLYLALNYMDRFLSACELPRAKTWIMHLVAVTCLALAAKMEETVVPLSLNIQVGEYPELFDAKTVQRMEIIVLEALNWRMQAVTPFSFIDYFLKKISGDESNSSPLIARATQLILGTFKGIEFLEYRPSEIAAAVAISVSGEAQAVDAETAISALIQHVQKDKVIKCVELIKGLSSLRDFSSASAPSVPQSPIGVLDAACFSCKTDDAAAVGSCTSSSHSSPIAKRRRLLVDL
ncbi:hypothetical protein ACH5RR_026966 [Cinchona calisaya]|uniref:Cyclin N-terminal domain-containing protein n=1 Tax=Cinchona calisaya TaxID=153742 RepID=A0ABD2Z590_9GENT